MTSQPRSNTLNEEYAAPDYVYREMNCLCVVGICSNVYGTGVWYCAFLVILNAH